MEQKFLNLIINPGSTSTKIGIYQNAELLFKANIQHPFSELKEKSLIDELPIRLSDILNSITNIIPLDKLSAVVGRGGLLKPISSGTYQIDANMLNDLEANKYGEHASNLGAIMAWEIAKKYHIPAFIVDPVSVDEFLPEARISGLVDLERKSQLHALNIKAVAHKIAHQLNIKLANANFVVAHLGSGISVAALKHGRIIDVNNANNEGPFSPERAGCLPAIGLIELAYSGKYNKEELIKRVIKEGGLYSYLGTKDIRDVEKRIENNDQYAELIMQALIHQIAKEIGAMSTVLSGEINGIILTGGLSYSQRLITALQNRIKFLAPIFVVPGEEELEALNFGALRVLTGEEEAKVY